MYVFVLFTYCMYKYIIYLLTVFYLLIAWWRIMRIDTYMYTRGSDMIFPEHVAVGDPVTAMRSHKGTTNPRGQTTTTKGIYQRTDAAQTRNHKTADSVE